MANLFYKMPADILNSEPAQIIMQEKGALSLFGLAMLMWFSIHDTRDKRASSRMLKNAFSGISSEGQRKSVLESGFFDYDPDTDTYGIYADKTLSRTQPGAQPTAQPGAQPTTQPGAQPAAHTPVPIFEELDIELDIEGDLKRTNPTQGEIWEGVLLCCPDQSLRRLMQENWPLTVDFMVQHLKSSGKMAEVKDWKGLCDTLREMVQPAHPAFGGLKLWLEQVPKSDTERAFDSWISKQTNILQMQQPLTYQQFRDLVQLGFEATHVRSTIERLNNYPSTPTRYVSAFQTAKDWLQNPLR